ncbi:MAG: hypothetical protein V4724_28140 [Pseudomonadota bacterium]
MSPKSWRRCLAGLLLAAASGAVPAQTDAPIPTVTVPYTRDPVDKSYRKMMRGMERYARERALAPQSTLRFQVLPRLPTVKLDGVALQVIGDNITLPVPMSADHSFTLERNEQALREDAALVANRKTSSMTWRAMVRSAGVPEGMRRLGDLRLECLVGMEAGLVSNNSALFGWLSDMLNSPDQVCAAPDGNYLQFSERPLFGVTLLHGTRQATLPFRMLYAGGTQTPETLPFCDCQVLLDHSYYAPVWDKRWPDDTLVAFDYMDDAVAPEAVPPSYLSTRDQVRAVYGRPANVLRFDSGYEVWMYAYPVPGASPRRSGAAPPQAEFVLLFGPDGTLRKTRRREPGQDGFE